MATLDALQSQLRHQLTSGSLNFFVGAGVSVPSMVPSGGEMSLELVRSWTQNPYQDMLVPYCENGSLRLEVLMQIARETLGDPRTITMPLMSILEKLPNLNHYVLARALKENCTVITTNFDILIELAYFDLYGTAPLVLVDDEDISWAQGRLEGTLVKLHGSLMKVEVDVNGVLQGSDTRDTIVAALDQVARGLSDSKASAVSHVLGKAPTMCWGYSCMDDFDVFPLLRTQAREPTVWLFFEPHTPATAFSSVQDWTDAMAKAGASRKFEADNVASVLRSGDTCLYGNAAPMVEKLAESIGGKRGAFGSDMASAIRNIRNSVRADAGSSTQRWQTDLLEARLLAQVGEWGQAMHELFSSAIGAPELNADQRARIQIEHAERTSPNSLEKAQEILEGANLESAEVSDATRAYGFAILSNIYRRRQSKEARPVIDRAMEIAEHRPVDEGTKHLVRHYESLVMHQEIAQSVRELPRVSVLPSDLLGRISQCETTLSEVSSFFRSSGQADNYAMSQNALGLVLLEKGRAYKSTGQTKEANATFREAERVLLENVAKMRERYGFFRGVGQAFRNIALVRREQERYEDELDAYRKSATFYSLVKPIPPETDLYETLFREAETQIQLGRREEAVLPALRWLLQKRASGDWHNEARGLKVLADALRHLRPGLDAQYAASWLVAIYRDRLSEPEKKEALFSKRYGVPNAKENLAFAKQLAEEMGNKSLAKEASDILERLRLAEEGGHKGNH